MATPLDHALATDRLARLVRDELWPRYLRLCGPAPVADAMALDSALRATFDTLGYDWPVVAAPAPTKAVVAPGATPGAPPAMRRVARAQFDQLIDKGAYFVRLIRLDDPMPLLVWEGQMPLKIERHHIPARKKRGLSPNTLNLYIGTGLWCGYSGEDIENDGSLVLEDFLMEVYAPWGTGGALEPVGDDPNWLHYDTLLSTRVAQERALPPCERFLPARA